MEDLDLLRQGAQETLGMLSRAAGQVRTELSRARRRFDGLKEERLAASARLGVVEGRRWMVAPLQVVPIIGGWALDRFEGEVNGLKAQISGHASEMATLKKRGARQADFVRRCIKVGEKLAKARHAMEILGVLPEEMRESAETAANRALFLKASREKSKGEKALAIGEDMIQIVLTWAKAKAIAEERAKRDRKRRAAAGASPQAARVYLPIPSGMRQSAEKAGAVYDPSASGSRMFVTLDQNLAPLQKMLPLAYRERHTSFEFPPIRHNAAGQNLWSVFDKGTWDHIRMSAYEHAGRRCMICGRQRGFILDKVLPEEQRQRGPVDCHEVWEWEVPDLKEGIGIQRLKQILVVCVDCHMMFHEGFALEKARAAGLEEKVKEFIRKRRMLVNRVNDAQLTEMLEKSREEWKRTDGVTKWVMDLSHLAAQDYMQHHEPVMVEDNRAGVRPEDIAGIDFVTDRGESHYARSAMDVYNDLAGLTRAYLP